MKKYILPVLSFAGISLFSFCPGAADSLVYMKTSYMIPMRDGILLNTIVHHSG